MIQTHSIHIVRRYGPVGGMENYVYQLTRALVKKGQRVTVLCESFEGDGHDGLEVVELGNFFRKPRWLAQWGFSRRVSAYLAKQTLSGVLVHSHERTANHHVTTFHGPPFLIRKKKALDVLSPRIHMWSYLEKRELLSPQVQAILPNSDLIAEQLESLYPDAVVNIMPPAYPGVAPHFSAIKRQSNGLTVGFLGKEWKRKGLDIACQVISELRQHLPDVHFIVAGCRPAEINLLFKDWPEDSYTLAGWVETEAFFGNIDLLLHPARAEPFGMVIAEANAAGIPVVISDLCGVASLVGKDQGDVCILSRGQVNIAEWVDACLRRLQSTSQVTSLGLSWDALAEQHIQLYRHLMD